MRKTRSGTHGGQPVCDETANDFPTKKQQSKDIKGQHRKKTRRGHSES